jgi:sialidase-1
MCHYYNLNVLLLLLFIFINSLNIMIIYVRAENINIAEGIGINKIFIPGEEGYVAFRIPGIEVIDSKNIFVFAEGRRFGCGDFDGEHDVVFKRSLNAGETWSKISVLMNPYKMFDENICSFDNRKSKTNACQFWDPTPVYDKNTKTIHVLAAFSNSSKNRMSRVMWVYSISSGDLGVTWSMPKNITDQVLSLKYGVPTPSNGHGIQLSNGNLIIPNYIRPNGDATVMSGIFYSNNHGQIWQFAESSLIGRGTSESEVVELYNSLNDNNINNSEPTLLFNHRRSKDSQEDTECDGLAGHQNGCRWQSISNDGGMTFTNFHAMPRLPDPSNKGGVCRYNEKNALLFTNTATSINEARVNVTLRISYDNGVNWDRVRVVSYWGGYSDVQTVAVDGKTMAAVIYENNTCAINLNIVELP